MGLITGKSNKNADVVGDRLLTSSVVYGIDEQQTELSNAWVLHMPARTVSAGGPGSANRILLFWLQNNSSSNYLVKNFTLSATKAVKTLGTGGNLYEDEVYCVRQDVRINLIQGLTPTFSASGSEDVTNLDISNQIDPEGIDFRIAASPSIANYTMTGSIINCATWYPEFGEASFHKYVVKLGPGQTLGLTINSPDANVYQQFAGYCTLFKQTAGVGV